MSTRIEIHGQGNGIGPSSTPNNAPIIDRSFPGILAGKISESEWITFCNEVDRVLAPIGQLKTRQNREMGIVAIVYIVLIVTAGFGVALPTLQTAGFGVALPTSSILYIVFPIFFIVIIGMMLRNYSFIKKAEEIMNDLETVIQLKSAEKSEISFHVRGESFGGGGKTRRARMITYIECSVGNAYGSTNIVSTMEAGGLPQRLQELEGIKYLISEEEYNTKRQEILNAI